MSAGQLATSIDPTSGHYSNATGLLASRQWNKNQGPNELITYKPVFRMYINHTIFETNKQIEYNKHIIIKFY